MSDTTDTTPRLEDVVSRALESRLSDLHTAMPGRVQSYNATTQTAVVQPLLQRAVRKRTGGYALETYPVLPDVKVLQPRFGDFLINMPVSVGDTVLLVFCERDPGAFERTGAVSDPGDLRLHPLSGAVAVIGYFSTDNTEPLASATELVIGHRTGPQIRISATNITLGTSPYADAMALAGLVEAALNTLKAAISAAPVLANDGGATFKAALISSLASWPPSVGSTVVGSD